jgi:type IV pilus assembly protein PilE
MEQAMTVHRNIEWSQRQSGVTLVELLIVVVIVAILGNLAVSSYRSQMMRANRVDATSMLLQIQVAQEKYFLQNNRYADGTEFTAAPPGGLGFTATTPGGHYTLALVRPTTATYSVTATPAGTQANDSDCTAFTIDQSGGRTPAAGTHCWR